MKQTVEEAAKEHQSHFETCDTEGTISGYINGVYKQSYKSFIVGSEWQKERAIEALSSVLDNWVHGGDADCIIAEFEEKLNNMKGD